MSETISFEEIPYDWRKPGTYVEIRPSYQNLGVLGYPARVLLIGQMLATGTAAEAFPQRITRADQAPALFGAGSVCAEMAEAFRAANQTTDLYVMGLNDAAAAVAAAGSVVLAGSPTASGTLALYIGGQRIAVPVAAGATVADIATAVRAAITAKTGLPVTSGGAAGSVTLTAKQKGTVGNLIDLRLNRLAGEATPPGLTVTITAMSGGTGDPDLQDALDAIAAEWFTDIAVAWTDTANLNALVADLATRYQAMGAMDAHAYAGLRGTFGALSAAGAARNSPHLTIIGANASPTSPWAWAASLAGVAAFHLTNDPARQLRSLALPGIQPPEPALRFTMTEQDLLLRDGISTFEVSNDGTVRLDRVLTTYQKSALDVDDVAWLDIMVPKTMSRIRYDWASYVGLTFPRSKLADDGSPVAEYGAAFVTPRLMHAAWSARCTLYEREGWIESATRTVAESSFLRDADDRNRMNARQLVRVVGNLMVLAGSLQFEV
ncbi:phage tail protein [Roseomonas eburnea]|uniref:Phage tail protein n=1 Tax=Neoroseomonas eburnea TaxID=1346889 RepID=A0A9X9XDX5_9PROT|nr:phage tail sheath subtilisin-like domain-containing protein [Neoroseomonas eburnea]MBR0681911.1 phage tail protein [Neoroseomonas eburnea]